MRKNSPQRNHRLRGAEHFGCTAGKLAQVSQSLREIVQAIGENRLTEELLRPAKDSVLQMIQLTKDSLPFSRADPPITAVVWSIFFQMTASGIPLPMSKLPLQSV